MQQTMRRSEHTALAANGEARDVAPGKGIKNPKDVVGGGKLPMSWVPRTLGALASLAFLEGGLKYGRFNWRKAPVRASIYLDAIDRHLASFTDGEWADPSTHVPHLASVVANAAIILDAKACGTLIDDRPAPAPTAETIRDLARSTVSRLHDLYGTCDPVHCTRELDAGVSP